MTHEVAVVPSLPSAVTVAAISPETVTVTVTERPTPSPAPTATPIASAGADHRPPARRSALTHSALTIPPSTPAHEDPA